MLDTRVDVQDDRADRSSRVMTMPPSPRVERLRQRYLDTKDKAVIDIARIVTKVMKETEGEPIVTRRGKAFAAIVRGVPVNIYPDELFVGWLFSEPRGTEVWVDQFWLEREFDTISTRETTPFLISEADKRELKEDIFPYWKTQRHSPFIPPALQKEGIVAAGGMKFLPHSIANYEKVLKKGILGIKEDAEERLSRIDLLDPAELEKVPFLQGVIMGLEAAAEIGIRFAEKARERAEGESDAIRKAELLKIAEICSRVPAHPAETFHEALQSVWFTHIMLGWEVSAYAGMSPGRSDQYLYPYYEKDIREGRITPEAAQELLDCWCMRYSQHYMMWQDSPYSISNHTPAHHIDVGGLNADGSNGANDLSYMFLEAMMHTPGMVEPTLGLLVHSKTPDDLLIKACQLTAMGGGYPMYINQDLMVDNLRVRGEATGGRPVTLAIARQFGAGGGCHEPTLSGMESGWYGAGGVRPGIRMATLPAALELALTNGMTRFGDKRVGLETGDPTQFETYEAFRDAYKAQLAWLIKTNSIAANIGEIAHLQPTVFASAITEDCIESGIAKEKGGARYNVGGGTGLTGSVDIGNSLAAIKKLVFDEEKVSMAEMCEALENNFEGHDALHRMCLDVPKFGNDEDDVDEQVAWVTHVTAEETKKYKTTYGGHRFAMQVPMSTYVPAGLPVGALPSGRLSGEPLAAAFSPTQGSDTKGPTAVLKSLGKVDNAEVSLGQTLNMTLDPAVFEKDDGVKRLADLIRTFVDQKLDQVQFNVVSADTLRAAQEEPDKHRELVVKVAGYNARFTLLQKEIQDSIIARTEHGL
ncbi:MAG: pyruvate formate lyase family protein [Desulfobacterales bacterium]